MNLKTMFKNYEHYLKFYRKEGTLKAYKKDFKLLNRIFENLLIFDTNEFTVNTYDQMIRWIKNNTKKKNSKTNSVMSSFLTVLNYHNISYDFKIIKLTDDTTPFRIINDSDLIKLFNYLLSLDITKSNNLVWITSIFLAFDTGARKNELLNIKTNDVDFDNKQIYLQTTKTEKRIVRFGQLSFNYLKKIYNVDHEYLLHNRLRNEKLKKKSLEWFCYKINKYNNFDGGNITLHRIRKTFATKLYLKGCPLPSIQKVLGHQDIRMTMKYIDVSSLTLSRHYDQYYPY